MFDKMRTTAYHPSCNGVVEQFHATLNSIMDRLLDENQAHWDAQLPYAMAAYRAFQHEATKFERVPHTTADARQTTAVEHQTSADEQVSPANYLILGREVRAPVDLVYGTP